MAVAFYPGSFDPLHRGHLDVIDQALDLFGSVVVGVLVNFEKPSGLFSPVQRVQLIEASLDGRPGVRVAAYGGLAIEAVREAAADFIVKGLRSGADFDVEQQMAHMNRSVGHVRTVFVPCRPDLGFVSSRFIREIASRGGDITELVTDPVAAALSTTFAPSEQAGTQP